MAQAIKSMKLYSAVDRIWADLRVAGVAAEGPIAVETLSQVDQLHYFGTDAVDEAIAGIGIGPQARVLDVGSGFGGPARWIAHRTGARVDAVELQPDLNACAGALTERAGLAGLVTHVAGDIQEVALAPQGHDSVVSWLALYHIPQRETLWPKLWQALRPGGMVHVEDLFQRGRFKGEETEALATMLYANTMTDQEGYGAELTSAGFEDIQFTEMTEPWTGFTAQRLAAFEAGREAYEASHGVETFDALAAFYRTIAGLFAGGNLGGARITARKP
ncbi:MAG: methyltransferase domain-containing protein [Pseudomonadota bacterium]